jgi:hypothetical membrane protein
MWMIKSDYIIKFSGICGIALPIIFLVVLFVSIQYAPWFSWTNNAISDLGRPEFGLDFFNYTLIAVGILLLFFSFGLYYSLKKERAGPLILAISSLYFIGVGIFPLPDPNHVDISGLFFIAFPLGFLILGLHMHTQATPFIKIMGIYAIGITGIAGCSPIFLLLYSGIAIPEIIILTPGFFWCMRFGIHMLSLKTETEEVKKNKT